MLRHPLNSFRLLVPVKPFQLAKTRLDVSATERLSVAEGLFVRTLRVALSCLAPKQVFVVSDDAEVMRLAREVEVETLPDPSLDLNEALGSAIDAVQARFPLDNIAVLVADLPRLAPEMLRRVLLDCAASPQARHVIDHRGTGTTFLSIPAGMRMPLLFGQGSAARFNAAGSVPAQAHAAVTHDLDFLADFGSLEQLRKENLCLTTPSR